MGDDEGERHRHQCKEGGRTRPAAIGHPPGNRGGHGARRTGQCKERDLTLAQIEMRSTQIKRRRGPEQAESRKQEGVIDRPPPQDRRVKRQPAHRGHQGPIAQPRIGHAGGQKPEKHHGKKRHDCRRRQKNTAP
ncbi:hypothetical protein D3C78_1174030 [compost metagenome]